MPLLPAPALDFEIRRLEGNIVDAYSLPLS